MSVCYLLKLLIVTLHYEYCFVFTIRVLGYDIGVVYAVGRLCVDLRFVCLILSEIVWVLFAVALCFEVFLWLLNCCLAVV